MAPGSGVLDVRQAGEFLGAHAETVRRLARRHEIPAYKIGRDWRFQKDALQHWSETHSVRTREAMILVLDDKASIRNLATGFNIETSFRQDKFHLVASLRLTYRLTIHHKRQKRAFSL